MEIITTNRRKQKACLDQADNQIRCQCVKCNNHCKGVISTSLDLSQLFNTKPHNHDANPMEVAVDKTKVDIKHLAANNRERPATMLSAKLAELPDAVRQLVGEENTMKKII